MLKARRQVLQEPSGHGAGREGRCFATLFVQCIQQLQNTPLRGHVRLQIAGMLSLYTPSGATCLLPNQMESTFRLGVRMLKCLLPVVNARYDADDQIVNTEVFTMALWWHDEVHFGAAYNACNQTSETLY